jgi:hypothetical protein
MERTNTTMVDWIRARRFTVSVWACVFCLILGTGLAMVIGRTAPQYWIIFGGNEDPGNGQGDGQARQQMIAGGWTSEGSSFQVTWNADIGQGGAKVTNEAMAAAHAAYNEHCGSRNCIIAGFSLGNSPALQLAAEVGLAPENTYLFGAPQPATGVFHSAYTDHPLVAVWIQTFGGLFMNRPVAPGVQNFYVTRDPYANAAPQCAGPGLYALNLDGHYIISRDQANNSHIWTGPDGVINHEVDYVAPPGLPFSGSDESQLWSGCPLSGWHGDKAGEVPFPAPGGTGSEEPANPIGTEPVPPPIGS